MRNSAKAGFVLAVVIAVSFGLVGSSTAGDKGTWTVTFLEGPALEDWKGTLANDIADTGMIGGAWFDENLGWHAAYWSKGTCYDLEDEIGIPKGATQSNVLSINAAGQMAGYAYSDDFSIYSAMLWNVKQGTYVDLHPDGWDASLAYGINARGDAVGYVVEDPSADNPLLPFWLHAYVWPKGDTDGYTLPGTYDYAYSQAFGINASGTIVGWGLTFAFEFRTLVWEKDEAGDYSLVNLHDEEFDGDDWVDSEGLDISESGKVVGRAYYDSTQPGLPYQWTAKGGFEELDEDSAGYGIAWKVNGNYIAGGIGQGRIWLGQGIADKAVVWWKGTLDVVVDAKGKYESFECASVNRKGAVAGFGVMDDDGDPSTSEDEFPIGFTATK